MTTMRNLDERLGLKLALSVTLASLLILLAIVAFPVGRKLEAAMASWPEVTEWAPFTELLVQICRWIRLGGWILVPVLFGIGWSAWRGRLDRFLTPLTVAGVLALLVLALLAGEGTSAPFSYPATFGDEP